MLLSDKPPSNSMLISCELLDANSNKFSSKTEQFHAVTPKKKNMNRERIVTGAYGMLRFSLCLGMRLEHPGQITPALSVDCLAPRGGFCVY